MEKKLIKLILFILCLFFVIFSFAPSLYELLSKSKLPPERTFVLEHNYMFDYNFYLSRIKEGQEGRWLVVEKYYNQPHSGSFLQIFYLMLGKVGEIFRLSPPVVYHLSRLIFGFILLILIAKLCEKLLAGWWSVIAYLLVVTAGSFPILVKAGNFWRFGTYMGWWSVIDSLQRITFIPHVVFGQIGLVLIVFSFGEAKDMSPIKLIILGVFGFVIGIVFPPAVIVIYVIFGILSFWELLGKPREIRKWFNKKGLPRLIFIILSFPSFIYLNWILKEPPWNALSLFDMQHRIPIPYMEYFLALGPMLPLGALGLIIAFFKKEKKLYPFISWVIAVFLLFRIFENFPQQSPSRFTEAAIFIPLGILTAYFFQTLLTALPLVLSRLSLSVSAPFSEASVRANGSPSRRATRLVTAVIYLIIILIILMGLGVMLSMVGWLTDQAKAKREGTFQVPVGAEIIYPLKDFMDGIYFLRDNTNHDSVVLGYITSGNFIPAYAGNYVYIGHANTPDEDGKEKVAARFFGGDMGKDEARQFLFDNHISYIYFGPGEMEIGNINKLESKYPFIEPIYTNNRVTIYKVRL